MNGPRRSPWPTRTPRLVTLAEAEKLMPMASREEIRAGVSRARLDDPTLPLHVTPRLAAWLLCVDRTVIRGALAEGLLPADWCDGCELSRSLHRAIPLAAIISRLEQREARVAKQRWRRSKAEG
jgi:hypothetical protein